ncbi:MAG: FtsW/RodA/SpoVE family cell cycle protein [Kiritimatiellia bacterium]|jgi:cell division protein FtsW (lipid II flippase)
MFLPLVILPLLVVLPLHLSLLTVHLANTPLIETATFAPLGVFAVALLFVYAALRLAGYRGSIAVPSAVMTLCGIGLALQTRIGAAQTLALATPSQLALPAGLVLMVLVYALGRHGRIGRLEPLWPAFLGLALLVLGFVLVAGRKYRGAVFLPGNVNPVEIIKPLLVLALAGILAGHGKLLARGFLGIPLPPLNVLVTVGILWIPPMALLVLQGDMGMFALMNATLLVMLYAATKRSAYLFGGFAAVFFLARLLIPLSARGRARLAAWLDPFTAATGGGWQPLQALVALYTGGLLGTGLGAGSPNVVPIVESDFAYVIIGEELGLVGCILVAALYATLVLGGLRVAERTPDPFRAAAATGLSACLGLQILLNIGGVVKAIPLTGIPLPLISHGGSSLATTFLMAGLLLAIDDDRAPQSRRGGVSSPPSAPKPKAPSPKPKKPSPAGGHRVPTQPPPKRKRKPPADNG